MPSAMVSKQWELGYDAAIAQVRKLVSKRDTWMTPSDDEPRDPESYRDFGMWLDEEIEGWEETDHFQVQYGSKLVDLARDVAEQNGLEGEAWIDIWTEFKIEFWEAWADLHHADKFWAKNIKEQPTIVIFRVWEEKDSGWGTEVLALFPEVPADVNGTCCTSYQHVGQHGQADYDHCIRKSRPATPEEYAELKAELERKGYKLKVKRRVTYAMHQKRRQRAADQGK